MTAKTNTYTLRENSTGKIFNLSLNDKVLISTQGKPDKLKTTEKAFPSVEEASRQALKKAWELLKKGYVLKNDQPAAGEAGLHYFVGSGYTGSLAFEHTPDGIYVYKHGHFNNPTDQQDFMVRIDTEGNLLETILLPKILAWDMQYSPISNLLLLDLDHYIFEYTLSGKTFRQLIKGENGRTSFISIRGGKTAFATRETLFLTDPQNNVLLEQEYTIETIMGSIPFCARLSKSGEQMAFYHKEGEIELISSKDGQIIRKITGDFERVDQMEFAHEDQLLIIRALYGSRGLRYFDLSTGQEQAFESLEIPEYSKEVKAFCLNNDQSRLVLLQRTRAYVYDFKQKKLLYSFAIDHCVKTAKIKFIGDLLGVRTDYGCFSLYAI
ncbi:WD40 repeat domain-containing protein [Pedobacter caeni]|uniref:WGR domain-containing protein n=1 Tax=Pedobacter caeni TaxID=288992 RepID=A0A1M4W8R3_9SPHI|nr:WD40 repeat domain-containing protein [Pedobacter caeni]SHE77550.1 hypothetical protein SAMN04488522_1011177 [Pedobacter caeni]